jgi:hypothetical protein
MPHICSDEVIAFFAAISFVGPLCITVRTKWRAWKARR